MFNSHRPFDAKTRRNLAQIGAIIIEVIDANGRDVYIVDVQGQRRSFTRLQLIQFAFGGRSNFSH